MVQQGNKKLNEKRIHPCHKPILLYKKLLSDYAKPGDKILDTHLGSGSSRIACHDGGFDFTGFEIDKDYFDASVKRFEQHIRQQTLQFD
jgi:site-specific DNA-methyltransferase (adenine-specific)